MTAKETLFKKLTSVENKESNIEYLKNSLYIKITIFIVTVLLCTFFFSFHSNPERNEILLLNLEPGNKWNGQTIVAEFSFPIYKDENEYNKEIQEAIGNVNPTFIFDETAENNSNNLLDTIFKKLFLKAQKQNVDLKNYFSDFTLNDYFRDNPEQKIQELSNIQRKLKLFISNIYKKGLIDTAKASIQKSEITAYLLPNKIKIYQTVDLIDIGLFVEKGRSLFPADLNEPAKILINDILIKVYKANLKFSSDLFEKAKEIARQNVARTNGYVRAGDVLIEKGAKLTKEIIQKLNSYNHSQFMRKEDVTTIWMVLGSFGHALLVYSILIIYLVIIRKRIFADNLQVAILSGFIVIVAFLGWLSVEIPSKLPLQYFVLIPGFSMLVAILFDSRTAFYFTVCISLMLSGIRGNDYDTGMSMMFAGILAAYTVRDIQSRTQIYKSILFIIIGFFVTIISFSLERGSEFDITAYRLLISVLNAALSPLLTFGLLFIIERFSNITTDLKLEEFNDLNHPLLQKMSELAPGTYQHTLAISVIAEKCAAAINANPLLAKVGAYYHDIGKIVKPEYYIENQLNIDNKHEFMHPKKSADAIKNHVIDGIRVGKEYKLPQRIIDFIPMHHGTSLIKHFYAKALEEADGQPVNQDDYRYPGPKPNSKETAIVMICDSAEALSRLATDIESLENAIEKSIQAKLNDGQFDESNLTIGDLKIIKETCVKNLLGLQHSRIEYKEIPTETKEENKTEKD
ncbi:MAG: HDIG domain-containing protein [Candidatus Kapabacteria bacterium]|nr:HDIG domain-containing protein [Candidatus Kapabacteria bacterium]